MQTHSFARNLLRGVKDRIVSPFRGGADGGLGWFLEKWLKHIPAGRERTLRLNGLLFRFRNPAEFLHTYREIYGHGIYDIPLGPAPLILDCGANIGIATLYLKQRHPDAEVIAFEPDATNFALLEANVGAAGFGGVTLRREAVWKADGAIRFSLDASMGSRIEDGATAGGRTQSVPAVRLRNLIDRRVDFLKLDIEGAEYEVLKDIEGVLGHVRHLFLEYHGDFADGGRLAEIASILSRNGFAYYVREAADPHPHPFRRSGPKPMYDVQLNIFCFREA
jgi:FkbM family methyltransferase